MKNFNNSRKHSQWAVWAQVVCRLRRSRRQLWSLVILFAGFVVTYYACYWVRFEGQLTKNEWMIFSRTVLGVVGIKLLVFFWFRICQGWGQYVTFQDLISLGQAASCATLAIILWDYLLVHYLMIPRSIVVMDWGATIMVLGGMRALSRIVHDCGGPIFLSSQRTPALIVGTGDAGECLLRFIYRNRNRGACYQAIGFISDDAEAVGSRIGGVPILGTIDQLGTLVLKHGVRHILITNGELTARQISQLVQDAQGLGVHVRVLPSYEQLLDERVTVQPREVAIEDLLQRDPVDLDVKKIHRWLGGRVLMVTGSCGSIGSEICRQLAELTPDRLVLIDRSENGQFHLERELRQLAPSMEIDVCVGDVTDLIRMDQLFEAYRPDIVFHAAAYKHVPLMEANTGEAVKNIVLATQQLADLADKHSVTSFVMLSTDKAVNPTSVMGACKRVAEQYVQSLSQSSSCRFVTVRFGNVLDSAGSVVPLFRGQIAEGGPVTITHAEMTRYFMTIPEASQLVIQAGAMGHGGEIFALDMGEPVKIVDLATQMIQLSGLEVTHDIEIKEIGMRPGEKLYEELSADGEICVATPHPKIMICQGPCCDVVHILAAINELASVMERPRREVVEQLRKIVPEFSGSLPVRDDQQLLVA